MAGHSRKCTDLTKRWSKQRLECVLCPLRAGHEVTPNCGYDDRGGRHESSFKPCEPGTFNTGSWPYCKICASCPPGYLISHPCSTTSDTKCEETRHGAAAVPDREPRTSQTASASFNPALTTNQADTLSQSARNSVQATSPDPVLWAVPLAIFISIMMLVLLLAFVFYKKRKNGQSTALSCSRRSSYINTGFSPLSSQPAIRHLEDDLSPEVQSAPMKTVLDNLDVLEELVILLDPESHGVKNTKHLASLCYFPSTWITYAYSMKDSKSPLKAVLEGVTSRNPDWTVGHLAKLLQQLDRNDAVDVLYKIRLSEVDV
ncbi:IGF-like family receptor 1 isoform X1 [Xyrichtys novacula]|nr:IGF-like family receptor 1 isoform X1 [Xyrichtys novacula]